MRREFEGQLLRIFVGEADRHEGHPLHLAIIKRARDFGMAGATVLRGLEGYGAHSQLHTARILRLSDDLPLVIEIVDSSEKVQAFVEELDGMFEGGLITVENLTRIQFTSAEHREETGDET